MTDSIRPDFDPESRSPGLLLLHPVVLAAVVILAVNDHLLKSAYPGWLTGKVSDIAGLIFFPLLLQALWQLATREPRPSEMRPTLIICVAVTAVGFTATKLVPAVTDTVAHTMGIAQWLLAVPISAVLAADMPALRPVLITRDATDLIALPALLLPLGIAPAVSRRPEASGSSRNRHLRRLGALVLAALATLGTSQSSPGTVGSDDVVFQLPEEGPARWRVRLEVKASTFSIPTTEREISFLVEEEGAINTPPTGIELTVVELNTGRREKTTEIDSGRIMVIDTPFPVQCTGKSGCEAEFAVEIRSIDKELTGDWYWFGVVATVGYDLDAVEPEGAGISVRIERLEPP